jgi:hypothetical protein
MEVKNKMEQHKAIQREDGSVYCKCPCCVNQEENAMVSMNYRTKKMICSVCGEDVKEK